ncbi:hypothetical protein [Pseudomonas sp. BN102]|uniref:hypothetical protein n=1 Tax=Pseudomonas sp. BN102 TaxID=2567886 RepID=UPI002456C1FF|nr:hypothetical protein [Pseudomonas sp. BN102]
MTITITSMPISPMAATVTATAVTTVTATAVTTVAASAITAVTTATAVATTVAATVTTASPSATAATVAASATTTVTAIFGIHAGETTDVIGHQNSRCRQDSANGQSQQTFLEQHDAPPLGVA